MKILYCMPSLESVYAARFIYEGYKNAFIDLKHEFRPYTSNDDLKAVLDDFRPDIFMYSLNMYHLKFVDLELLKSYREQGLVVYCQIGAWNGTSAKVEAISSALKHRHEQVALIKNALAGDIYWHWFKQDEPLMDGFTQTTGRTFSTIHLAADKTQYYQSVDAQFECDVCYVGSNLPAKRDFFKKHIYPLKSKYDLRTYGSDWTLNSRILGKIQKVGQYFNINQLKKVRSLSLTLNDERKLYSTARISLNVHEEQVKIHNCEINERTFKILACGGFQICDDVPLLRNFFNSSELVIAESTADWFDKIAYFLEHPEQRRSIAEAGRKKVLSEHTYHNRVKQVEDLYMDFKK